MDTHDTSYHAPSSPAQRKAAADAQLETARAQVESSPLWLLSKEERKQLLLLWNENRKERDAIKKQFSSLIRQRKTMGSDAAQTDAFEQQHKMLCAAREANRRQYETEQLGLLDEVLGLLVSYPRLYHPLSTSLQASTVPADAKNADAALKYHADSISTIRAFDALVQHYDRGSDSAPNKVLSYYNKVYKNTWLREEPTLNGSDNDLFFTNKGKEIRKFANALEQELSPDDSISMRLMDDASFVDPICSAFHISKSDLALYLWKNPIVQSLDNPQHASAASEDAERDAVEDDESPALEPSSPAFSHEAFPSLIRYFSVTTQAEQNRHFKEYGTLWTNGILNYLRDPENSESDVYASCDDLGVLVDHSLFWDKMLNVDYSLFLLVNEPPIDRRDDASMRALASNPLNDPHVSPSQKAISLYKKSLTGKKEDKSTVSKRSKKFKALLLEIYSRSNRTSS